MKTRNISLFTATLAVFLLFVFLINMVTNNRVGAESSPALQASVSSQSADTQDEDDFDEEDDDDIDEEDEDYDDEEDDFDDEEDDFDDEEDDFDDEEDDFDDEEDDEDWDDEEDQDDDDDEDHDEDEDEEEWDDDEWDEDGDEEEEMEFELRHLELERAGLETGFGRLELVTRVAEIASDELGAACYAVMHVNEYMEQERAIEFLEDVLGDTESNAIRRVIRMKLMELHAEMDHEDDVVSNMKSLILGR